MNDARYARLVEIHRVRKLSTAKARSDPITGYLQVINRKPLALCEYRHEQVGVRMEELLEAFRKRNSKGRSQGKRAGGPPRPGPFR